MNETTQPQVTDIPVPPVCPTCDTVIVLGTLTGTCETFKDEKGKNDCRKLLEPLEQGKSNAIDAFANMMVKNPGAVDAITDRFNYLIQEASKKAEEMVKTGEAPK